MRNIGLIFIVVLLLPGCGKGGYRLTPEQQAYEFVFNELVQDATKEILIFENASLGIVRSMKMGELLDGYPKLMNYPAHLLEDIMRDSDSESRLDWKPIMVKVRFIDIRQPRGKERNQFWFKFNDLYPEHSGYYSVSKVAFDSASKDAVLVFSYSCAALCGAHDSILHLRKSGSEWELIDGVRLWVS